MRTSYGLAGGRQKTPLKIMETIRRSAQEVEEALKAENIQRTGDGTLVMSMAEEYALAKRLNVPVEAIWAHFPSMTLSAGKMGGYEGKLGRRTTYARLLIRKKRSSATARKNAGAVP